MTDVVPESIFVTIPETVTDVETAVVTSTDFEPSIVTVFVTETTTSARVTIEPFKERRQRASRRRATGNQQLPGRGLPDRRA